jgi:hypothetical protein
VVVVCNNVAFYCHSYTIGLQFHRVLLQDPYSSNITVNDTISAVPAVLFADDMKACRSSKNFVGCHILRSDIDSVF